MRGCECILAYFKGKGDIMFDNAKWIWCNGSPKADEYGEFYSEFDYNSGDVILHISADSNYAAYLNGKLCAFGQYADFPYDKVYDEIDVTKYAEKGTNRLAIIVWYYGIDSTQVYYPGNAAVKFEVMCDGIQAARSDVGTLSRMSRTYVNHLEKQITNQVGFSFMYDATAEDGWMRGELADFSASHIVDQELPLRIRPCKKLYLDAPRVGKEFRRFSDTDLLFDLGTNEVGFIDIDVESDCEQELLIAYGEHIEDGCVRQKISTRDFSVQIKVGKGRTRYMNPFRRLGCKYLQVKSAEPVKINGIAVIPTMYPVSELKRPPLTKAEADIYDISLRTLRLCMHEHYEDCPWREQALYCMDSRNQMLFGYYAFGEYEFPRANLQLIGRDDRDDGLLSICYPIKKDLVIPSFALHYFTQCLEYYEYSGDASLLGEVYPKLCSILKVFTDKMEKAGDVILPFPKDWNFYEWRMGLDGHGGYNSQIPDLPLNALLSIALKNMDKICKIIGKPTFYGEIADKLNESINRTFFDGEKGLYFDQADTRRFSKLSNSLAILCGAADSELSKSICEKLTRDDTLTDITLSMQTFFFDALLLCDKNKYTNYILDEIERKYRPMVDYGVGTVWETEDGQSDFDNAGSLCHGWSALPIYYYHVLKK